MRRWRTFRQPFLLAFLEEEKSKYSRELHSALNPTKYSARRQALLSLTLHGRSGAKVLPTKVSFAQTHTHTRTTNMSIDITLG